MSQNVKNNTYWELIFFQSYTTVGGVTGGARVPKSGKNPKRQCAAAAFAAASPQGKTSILPVLPHMAPLTVSNTNLYLNYNFWTTYYIVLTFLSAIGDKIHHNK